MPRQTIFLATYRMGQLTIFPVTRRIHPLSGDVLYGPTDHLSDGRAYAVRTIFLVTYCITRHLPGDALYVPTDHLSGGMPYGPSLW